MIESCSMELNERWGLVGHAWAVDALEHAVRTRRAAHAFLFVGPHGVGKTTLARALARRLMCMAAGEQPCGVCRACIKNAKGVHPDVMLLEGVPSREFYTKNGSTAPPRKNDREKRILLVDQMREIEKWLSTAPFEGQYKVGIVRRFEDANEEAQNAFLKTLEEPPRYAVLILTAQDAGLLLPTIVSRAQPLNLRPVPVETVERALRERWQATPTQAQMLARVSGGRPGWAVRALAAPKLLEMRREALKALNALVQEGRAERVTRAETLAKDSSELPQLFETWQSWWRDVLLIAARGIDGSGKSSPNEGSPVEMQLTNVDYLNALREHAQSFSLEEIQRALNATRAAARQVGQNVNARLVTEVLALGLPRA